METLTTDQLEEMIDDGDALVVNVLDRQSFEHGHIPDSESVPISEDGFVDGVESLAERRDTTVDGRDATVVVYCAGPDCDASTRAAETLEEAGFTNVHDYEGGLEAWGKAGNQIERFQLAGLS